MQKHVRNRAGRTKVMAYQLLNEGPDLVGKMTAILENSGSLDTAVRELAKNGPKQSSELFKKIADDADTRVESDISLALSRRLSDLPEECGPYSMALRMLISASRTADPSEKSRILREASEIALNGLRDAGKTFCASLNTPCMVVFGIGIMVPIVLMSILPMMGLSGLYGATAVDSDMLTVVTLVFIPAVILSVIISLSDKNPLRSAKGSKDMTCALPLLAAIPLAVLIYDKTGDFPETICASVISASAICLLFNVKFIKTTDRHGKLESMMQNSVFEIGNRLLGGQPFESSVYETMSSRRELASLAETFRNENDLCRGDVASTIISVFGPVSTTISDTLVSIYTVSKKDLGDAGKLAVALGKQMKDREGLRRNIKNELRSMTDTMFGTAAVFAPLVLGLSIAMLEPMKAISAMTDAGETSCILSVYLVELCGIIALLLSFLDGKCGGGNIVRKFAMLAPISMTVFLVSMNLSL